MSSSNSSIFTSNTCENIQLFNKSSTAISSTSDFSANNFNSPLINASLSTLSQPSSVTKSSTSSSTNATSSQDLIKIVPYGKSNFRLLRFLPDGIGIWEAPPFPSYGISPELPLTSYTEPLGDLRQYAEALFLAVNTYRRLAPLIRSQNSAFTSSFSYPLWDEVILVRNQAILWLSNFLALIDLLLGTLNSSSTQQLLDSTSNNFSNSILLSNRAVSTPHNLYHENWTENTLIQNTGCFSFSSNSFLGLTPVRHQPEFFTLFIKHSKVDSYLNKDSFPTQFIQSYSSSKQSTNNSLNQESHQNFLKRQNKSMLQEEPKVKKQHHLSVKQINELESIENITRPTINTSNTNKFHENNNNLRAKGILETIDPTSSEYTSAEIKTKASNNESKLIVETGNIKNADQKIDNLPNQKNDREYFNINYSLRLKELRACIYRRKVVLNDLKQKCNTIQQQFMESISMQKQFLLILQQLRPFWILHRKQYMSADFTSTASDYPYIMEIIIEFFSLPSTRWNLIQQNTNIQPSLSNVKKQTQAKQPPFVAWQPFPYTPPFRTQFAHIRLSPGLKDLSADVLFEGSSAYFIEKEYNMKLSISLLPTIRDFKANANDRCVCSYTSITHPLALEIHTYLKAAQWILIERAIFSIISSHAQNYIHDNVVLDKNQIQRFKNDINYNINKNDKNVNYDNNLNINKEFKAYCINSDNKQLEMQILHPNGKIFLLKISYSPKSNVSTKTFHEDFVKQENNHNVVKNNENNLNNNENNINYNKLNMNYKSDLIDENDEQTTKKLLLLEDIALAKLNQFFFDEWKYQTFELPMQCMDISPDIFISPLYMHLQQNNTILHTFLVWLSQQISDLF